MYIYLIGYIVCILNLSKTNKGRFKIMRGLISSKWKYYRVLAIKDKSDGQNWAEDYFEHRYILLFFMFLELNTGYL